MPAPPRNPYEGYVIPDVQQELERAEEIIQRNIRNNFQEAEGYVVPNIQEEIIITTYGAGGSGGSAKNTVLKKDTKKDEKFDKNTIELKELLLYKNPKLREAIKHKRLNILAPNYIIHSFYTIKNATILVTHNNLKPCFNDVNLNSIEVQKQNLYAKYIRNPLMVINSGYWFYNKLMVNSTISLNDYYEKADETIKNLENKIK